MNEQWIPVVGERVVVDVGGYRFAGVVVEVDPRDYCVNPIRVKIDDMCWFHGDELAPAEATEGEGETR